MCLLATGTDTGGSIRIPAACCGVTGLKPTYGLVSCYGIIPLSWSLDHAGPLARSVEECALLLDALVGYDARDPASLAAAASQPAYAAALQLMQPELFPLTGIRIGVPEGSYFEAVEPEIAAIVSAAVQALKGLGAQVEGVMLPEELAGLFLAYRGVQMPEATAAHQEAGWWPTRADLYTPITRDRLKMGEHMPATDTARAERVRAAFAQGMRAVMERVNLLALPTLPILPPRRDALAQLFQLGGQQFDAAAALLRLTFPFNMTGQPALSLPCGFSSTGLPIGLQLVARHLDEATLLRVGHAYQQVTDRHLRQPAL
jgi:aspartyl-tRNA(Asn)/glutamyl-tRNA(Gln) amidotransferase subunit A